MCVYMYEIVSLGGNLCVYLWICGNMNEYVLICSNLSGSVGIGVDLYKSCVDLYGSMLICTKLHDTVLNCVYLNG